MLNIAICDLKNKNKITYNTVLSTCLLTILPSTINKTPEEIRTLIKEYCKKYEDSFTNDDVKPYDEKDINIYNAISTISWYSKDYNEQKRYINKIVPVFTNDQNELKTIDAICSIVMYLKKGNDKYNLKMKINNKEVETSYKLFLESNSFEEALNKTILNIKQNKISSYLTSIFAYAYYKYIPIDMEKNTLYNLSKQKHYFLLNKLTYHCRDIEYESVTTELLTEQTKYIGLKYTIESKEFIDFYHSKDLKVLINYLVFQDFQIFSSYDDSIAEDEMKFKNYIEFYELQKHNNLYKKNEIFDELKNITTILLTNNDNKQILKEQIARVNEILIKQEYSYEYVYLDNSLEVVNYILTNYNSPFDIYKNLTRYCLND